MEMTTSGTEINKNHRGASVNKTAEMTKMALMVAMNCVSAYIIIPLPFSLSPLALQTLIVNLTGYVLNAKPAAVRDRASCSDLPAVILSASCLPLFSWHISKEKNTTSSVMLCWAALSVFR